MTYVEEAAEITFPSSGFSDATIYKATCPVFSSLLCLGAHVLFIYRNSEFIVECDGVTACCLYGMNG